MAGFRFASLGSGSEGNALLVEVGATRVLLDCGFAVTETCRRLERLGVAPDSVDAVVVTHEHGDHVSGVPALARRFGMPVYLTHGTLRECEREFGGTDIRVIDGHARFSVGEVEIEPYPVPHDAGEPAQFVFSDGSRRLGVLTDAGAPTPHVAQVLSGVDALVLECNHDLDLLWGSRYPPSLKRRIAGRLGHLDNAAAAALLARIDRPACSIWSLRTSQQNNTPAHAAAALAAAAGCAPDWIGIADQETGFDWRVVA